MPDEIEQAYSAYKTDPTPDNLSVVVHKLKPTISYALAQHGAADDPLVHSKALLYAADAVESYDPKFGASLPTFTSHKMRQLTRAIRQSRSPVHIPERIQQDSFKLYQATQAFVDERGREPDTVELADFSNIPVKRIAKIRTFEIAQPSEEQVGDVEQHVPDVDHEALDYIMHDADHTDRRILEMKTGYGGHPILPPKEIAVALNLTPTQLTRRSMRLTKRINDIRASLEKL